MGVNGPNQKINVQKYVLNNTQRNSLDTSNVKNLSSSSSIYDFSNSDKQLSNKNLDSSLSNLFENASNEDVKHESFSGMLDLYIYDSWHKLLAHFMKGNASKTGEGNKTDKAEKQAETSNAQQGKETKQSQTLKDGKSAAEFAKEIYNDKSFKWGKTIAERNANLKKAGYSDEDIKNINAEMDNFRAKNSKDQNQKIAIDIINGTFGTGSSNIRAEIAKFKAEHKDLKIDAAAIEKYLGKSASRLLRTGGSNGHSKGGWKVNNANLDSLPDIKSVYNSNKGSKMANDAIRAASSMKSTGWCFKGVKAGLSKSGVNLWGGSAYMAADQLANNKNFKEVKVSSKDLSKLPAGAVVVWGPGKDAKHHPHGHISVSLGDGREASDHIQKQIQYMNNHGAGYRVFIPC